MKDLADLKVLVVEDEGPVAFLIEAMLMDLGCEVVASTARLTDARNKASTADIDLAILDVNLGGEPVFPVADILRKRSIPLVFSTGYGPSGFPQEFATDPVIGKPFSIDELRLKITQALRLAAT